MKNSAEIRSLIAPWAAEWGIPDLTDDVVVAFSSRLKVSLGRCNPATGRISLRRDLQTDRKSQLPEVLCHEVAHVAVHRIYGPHAAPHGPEWRRLVADAGFKPRVRAKGGGESARPSTGSGLLEVEHRCPVCQSVRYGRKAVSAWRCAECLDAGLSGELVITRHRASQGDS